jgi:hypothetical protein
MFMFVCCAGSVADKTLLRLPTKIVERANELIGYGYTNQKAMNTINSMWSTLAEATDRRISVTLYIIAFRFIPTTVELCRYWLSD